MQRKSLLALTAVAFVALMAFAQDIKTAINRNSSGLQTNGYVKTDNRKDADKTADYVCPGSAECQKAGCCHEEWCRNCPDDSVCTGNAVCGNGVHCVGNAPCVSGEACENVCPPGRRHHRSGGCHWRPAPRGCCHR